MGSLIECFRVQVPNFYAEKGFKKSMEKHQRVLINFQAIFYDLIYYLIRKLPCPQSEVDVRMNLLVQLNGCRHYFESKLGGLEIMRAYTLEKSRALERIPRGQYIRRELDEVAAFFEAYLSTLFSLLEITEVHTTILQKRLL